MIAASPILPLLLAKRVGRTIIEVRRIRLIASASLPGIIHFRAEVRTEHQPSHRIRLNQRVNFRAGQDTTKIARQVIDPPGELHSIIFYLHCIIYPRGRSSPGRGTVFLMVQMLSNHAERLCTSWRLPNSGFSFLPLGRLGFY